MFVKNNIRDSEDRERKREKIDIQEINSSNSNMHF